MIENEVSFFANVVNLLMIGDLIGSLFLQVYVNAISLNLIAEIGAVLAPVVSGAIRDQTGNWGTELLLDGAIMAAGLVLIIFVSGKAVATSTVQRSA